MFLAQQSAEKYLKAVLVKNNIEVPKTHNLLALNSLVIPYLFLSIDKVSLAFMSTGSVKTRYPGDEPTQAMAEEALQIANQIEAQVLIYFQA